MSTGAWRVKDRDTAFRDEYIDIEKLGITWGWVTTNEKEKFYSNYWNMVANTILQLFNKHKLGL